MNLIFFSHGALNYVKLIFGFNRIMKHPLQRHLPSSEARGSRALHNTSRQNEEGDFFFFSTHSNSDLVAGHETAAVFKSQWETKWRRRCPKTQANSSLWFYLASILRRAEQEERFMHKRKKKKKFAATLKAFTATEWMKMFLMLQRTESVFSWGCKTPTWTHFLPLVLLF